MISNKNNLSLLLFFVLGLCYAQANVLFKGRVTSGSTGVKDVFVISKKTGAETKTDGSGYFSIATQPGDVLVVHGAKVVERQFALTNSSFENQLYIMSVNYQSYELEEVVIDKNNTMDAESLGLVPKGQQQFTQQQKKLYTATSNMPLYMLPIGLLTGSMPVDPFINAITGRTKRIKKDVANEKVRMAYEKISGLYTEEELTSKLKIPQDYAQGFLFYAAEDTAMATALETKTDEEVKFMLTTLASEYNRTIAGK